MPDQPHQPTPEPTPAVSAGFSADAGGDAFFILRDCRVLFVRRLEEIVRLAGTAQPGAIAAFSEALGASFDELAASAQRDGFGETDGLTASRISLVGNDGLELEIRIGELVSRLRDDPRIDHWHAQRRFMTLLARPKMDAASNPAGFLPISCGVLAMCRASERPLEQKLDQIDAIEEVLKLRLPEVYIELNALLERHRVEPAPVARGRSGASQGAVADQPAQHADSAAAGVNAKANTEANAKASAEANTGAPAALQQAMSRRAEVTSGLSAAGAGSVNPGASAPNSALDAAARVMLKHLFERLDTLERLQSPAPSLAPCPPGPTSGDRVPALRTLSSKDLDLPLGQPAAVALDTLALIFEAIFATPELPDAVKAAIARLQIPLLKLALVDAALLADPQHPARRLINRMARAALGLPANGGRDHPVCGALLKLADEVHATLASVNGDLSPHLAELATLIAARDRWHQESTEPYVRLAREHLAEESARDAAATWLAGALGRTGEPAMRSFLADYWSRVMQLASLDGGRTGDRWKDCRATADELLWSLTPKQTADERKQLLALIPELLKRINLGLDRLETPTAERKPFLDACFNLQTAALRNRADSLLPPPAPSKRQSPLVSSEVPPAERPAGPAAEMRIFERDGKRVHYLGRATVGPSSDHGDDHPWRVGDWIRLRRGDAGSAASLTGRVCAQDSFGVLLFNIDWGYAVVCAPSLLEQQIKNGDARIVTETSLFDVAAAKALQGLTVRSGSYAQTGSQ